jgi:hypothetical protein
MKFGGEIRLTKIYMNRLGGTTYSYPSLNAFLANTPTNIRFVGDLSDPSLINTGASGIRKAQQEFYIGFAQDEWKFSPKFTLSYGLRYEYYSPMREANHGDILFDINTGILKPTDSDFYKASKTNFAPRIGVGYSRTLKTAFRGGFGIYRPGSGRPDPIRSDLVNVLSNGGAYPLDIAAVAPTSQTIQTSPVAPRAYAGHYRVPERVYQYSFRSSRSFRKVRCNRRRGEPGSEPVSPQRRQPDVSVDPNNGTVTREFDIPQGPGVAPLRPYAEVDYKTSGGHDAYDSMQLSVVRRSASGLTLNGQYTLGHSRGTSTGSNEAITVGNNARNIADFDYDQGDNTFDVRHNFNASAVYEIPLGKGRRYGSNMGSFANLLLGGWQTSS